MGNDFFPGLVCGLLITLFVGFITNGHKEMEWRRTAVERGIAKWEVKTNGETKFVWIEK